MAWDGLKFLRCVQQKENERFKKIAAELQLDKLIMKERQYQTNDFLSTALATPQNRSIMTLTRDLDPPLVKDSLGPKYSDSGQFML